MLALFAFALDKLHCVNGKVHQRAGRSANGYCERKMSSQSPVRNPESGSNSKACTCTHTFCPLNWPAELQRGQVTVLRLSSCLLNWVRC